jgi:hypothetical protein
MTDTSNAAPLSGNVLFYRKPEPLNVELHRGLGIKRIDRPFAFMRSAHAVPVTVSEFGVASAHYPLIFVGEEKTPVAVMGARAGENLFVSNDGEPDAEAYIPAFVRRYPFVFATDDAADRLVLCIDRQAAMVSDQPEVPFFTGNEPSQFTQEAMEFCKEFERQRRATEEFIKIVTAAGLFETKTVTFTTRQPDGSEGPTQKIADYWAVSEEKLNALPTDQFMNLRDQGVLGVVYAHMISLLNWPKVIQRLLRITQAGGARLG